MVLVISAVYLGTTCSELPNLPLVTNLLIIMQMHFFDRFIHRHSFVQSFAEISQNLGFTDGTVSAGKLMDLAVENKHQTDEWMKSLSFLFTAFSKVGFALHFCPSFNTLVPVQDFV